MKAQELMVGDWVEIQDTPKYYKVFGIDILAKGDACRLTFEDYVVETWCDRVKPIPLTEDILKANGWEYDEIDYAWWCKGFTNIYKDKGGFHFYLDGIEIRLAHVHELQHALRLCGLADVANNLKIE